MKCTIVVEGVVNMSNATSAILPVDLQNLFLSELELQKREPDGLLHCSSDLLQPLRFTQLKAVGAPEITRPIAQEIRMLHGTLWHDWFHSVIEKTGIKFRYEVNLNEFLPEGWGGTADWLFWHPELEAWVLGDLKTVKGEGMFWLQKDGAKDTHIWQLSAYWHALANAGIPLVKGFGIMYWPMNDTNDTVDITPVVHECMPIEADELYERMQYIYDRVNAYRTAYAETSNYLNSELESMPSREVKSYWNKQTGVFDVKLVPVWYERYCDFDETLCPRSGSTKIGHWDLNQKFIPRKGYEVECASSDLAKPTVAEFNKRRASGI